ncbi:hypothetical protein [Synechococcus sp. M16CYN]
MTTQSDQEYFSLLACHSAFPEVALAWLGAATVTSACNANL